MNVLSNIICDTSSLLTSQNYKISENAIMSSQEIVSGQASLNLLDSSTHISTIGRSMASVNAHSSPSSIGLFNSSNEIHIPQNMDTDFDERSESVFTDPFAEIVPSWLTHDFMKVSDNLPSPSILSNVSDIYPTTQEDEHLEMLDLGFTTDLGSDLNRNCIDDSQKLLDLPMQQYSHGCPMLLSSLNNIGVSQMHMPVPVKNNLQYQKFKSNTQVNNSSNLIGTVLQCENDLVHLPIHSDLTSQCLTVNSSPSLIPNSQNHQNSVCDKLPDINLNQLNTFLGNNISDMQLLRQNFPSVSLSEANINHCSNDLNDCQSHNLNISTNNTSLITTNVIPLKSTTDASVQVSNEHLTESENCICCSKVNSEIPIEIIECFKCKLCDFISTHKCHIQNHYNTSHSKSLTISNGTTFNQQSNLNPTMTSTVTNLTNYLTTNNIVSSATIMPLNSHLPTSILSSESTYIQQSDNQVISKSSFISGHNLSSVPVQLDMNEAVPISYQIVPISEVVINPERNLENNEIYITNGLQYNSKEVVSKERPILEKPEDFTPEFKKNKSSKDEINSEKLISAQKNSWRKKIKRELGSYICEFKGCNVRFKALDNLEYHRKCHVSGGSAFACPECGLSFNKWGTMSGHLWRDHSNDMELHACDECPFRTFSFSRLENYHKKTHLDECLYLCDTCGKKFKNRKQLRNHRVIHNKNRKVRKRQHFTCKICTSHFMSRTLLHSHQELAHNLKHKIYSCSFCEYSTVKKETMNLHMRQHTGEKPFHCDNCEYKTADRSSLRRHKMIHSGKKCYSCPFCPYSSIQAQIYKNHLHKKHPEKNLIYTCKLCPFRTLKFETFGIHMQEHEHEMKHRQMNQSNEMHSTEEMLPLIEAMGIRLSNGDNSGYLNNGVNNQMLVNNVNATMV